ncbi:hypothetical protein BDD12DRAFT_873225 [Trichophaea hybrida]|nr:hypothetical protein BDD12DRAFT_873225 [Trichophaea hybrida]
MQIQPVQVEIEKDTLPELQPIFNFMNVHSQKLYTEGYFLKLADLKPDGKPGTDRSWKECFAQLRGTVLSLWDAAELDAAGQNQDIVPTFINLTDASIKMIDKMPTRSPDVPPLTNVLSISTAGRNRYLFHFNSHHSLAQWTASIRLCMFEHSKLQEIYTGALIAAKGKGLNAIGQITARTSFKYEEWVRVRFGAGTPWRKCWAVISQPDEKVVKKAKAMAKKSKGSSYPQIPLLKGDIKFYDTKKSKKTAPIATIVDAYAAYALYPQDKRLIDMSTLIKVEGRIKIHGDQPTESEGYVFVMPDVHPAVSGFETMLRFIFPTYDTFALYGRPGMLNPDKKDLQSLMFAMPIDASQQSGYLDVVDVVNLVVTDGNKIKLESEWRERLKVLTKEKIEMLSNRKGRPKSSIPAPSRLTFDSGSSSSLPHSRSDLPPQHVPMKMPLVPGHSRSTSDTMGYMHYQGQYLDPAGTSNQFQYRNPPPSSGRSETSSDDGLFQIDPAARRLQQQTNQPPPEPVPVTPRAIHPPSSRPQLPLPAVESPNDNLFAGVVPLRTEGERGLPLDPQQPVNRDREQFAGTPTQIAQRQSLGYDNQLEAPPGFALQSSHVLLRGPPPTHDQKILYDEEYANHPPPGRPESQDYGAQMPPAPEYTEHRRSWQSTPPSGSPSPHADYQDSCPTPAKPPLRVQTEPKDTRIMQKPVMSAVTEYETPDSLTDLTHLIDENALSRIGPQRKDSTPRSTPVDEDTFDRRAVARIQKVLAGGDSDSEYGDESEDEPDYASSVDTNAPPPKRDANMPRAGVMKIVGQKPDPEVVIGDVHYRPNSSGKPLEQVDIPKVDFGTTFSHGRSLSTDINMRGVSRGSVAAVGSDIYPASQHGTLVGSGGDHRRSPSTGDQLNTQHTRAPSRSSGASAEWNHPSPGSQESGSDQSKRRSVAWQPGMVPTQQGNSPDHTNAERYVAEKAAQAAAVSQSRNRYAHHRRSSNVTPRNQSAEHLPTRPSSRGGNAAFLPHGLVSSPDLSAHLSAREQEYVARKTGSTLIQMDDSQRKAPPHKAGLIGAIESRETEKKHMRESWQRGQSSVTVQQEIARRQQQQQQQQQAMRAGRTPSPRAKVQQFDQQQGYFPQQQGPPPPPQHQQLHQFQQQQQLFAQQQLQQQQQMAFSYGYSNQQPQGNRTLEGYQNQYYDGRH